MPDWQASPIVGGRRNLGAVWRVKTLPGMARQTCPPVVDSHAPGQPMRIEEDEICVLF